MQRCQSSHQMLHKSARGQVFFFFFENRSWVQCRRSTHRRCRRRFPRLYSKSVCVSFNSELISIIWGPDDEQLPQFKNKNTSPDFITNEIKLKKKNHTTSSKTCTWNYSSGGRTVTWFTTCKVHQINFSVRVNVVQLNILNCDSRKTNEGVWY